MKKSRKSVREKSPRKKAVQKAQARKAKAKKGSGLSLAALDARVREIAKVVLTNLQNIVGLDKRVTALAESERSLDHQVAVLTRITMSNLNKLRALVGEDFISEAEVSKVFDDWNVFHKRSDAKEHMTHWVLGKPIDDLPPDPNPPKEEENEGESPAPEGAEDEPTIFGGDYAESKNGNESTSEERPEDEAPGEEDEVPVLRTQDAPLDQGDEAGAAVSEVSA